jgi:apolipoprotein N-acyltransferase
LVGFVLATFLCFPHPVAGTVIDLGLVLAWVAPALLILGLEGLAVRRAAGLAYLAAVAANSLILHWIYVVTAVYGRAPAVVGVLAPVGLALYTGAFSAGFAALWVALRRRGRASPLAAALLWTATDHARSFLLSGFPWATLGYAQHLNPALLGIAPVTGVYGLSFASVLAGAALAEIARAALARRAPGRGAWVALAGVAAIHLMGALNPGPSVPESGPKLRVAALQGDIQQGVKWSREWMERTLEIYEGLAREAAARGAEVIVWPETAVPGALEANPEVRLRLSELARETGSAMVVGSVGVEVDSQGRLLRYYDSAFLFEADGLPAGRYDKSHLVPFGEYVPLRGLLGQVLGAVARGMARSDVSAGAGPRALSLASMKVGVPICYELLFPDLVRRFARDGAGVLFAITNDAWYGRTGAPYQFLAITAMRSAETGLWTVRAANTGVSAVIDGRGRVREGTDIFERDLIVADVPLRPLEAGRTFYVRHGDMFALACWAGAAICLALARFRPLREER